MSPAFVVLFGFGGVALLYNLSSIQLISVQHQKLFDTTRTGLFILLIFAACNAKQKNDTTPPQIKKAKAVPANYVSATDANFSKHQDTIYYKDKHFSGYIYALFPTNDTEFVQSYLNGLEEGEHRKWYPNKQVYEQRHYVDGKKEGIQQGWWPDGKQKFIYTASNDAYTGELKEWTSAGTLYRDFHYVNGQEEGSERMWWDDGSVRANYVIRNGKRYGLLGIKVCANPYDSINKK
jgi:antitoxin component YwqK of YwqJK toxin-antitoxin module